MSSPTQPASSSKESTPRLYPTSSHKASNPSNQQASTSLISSPAAVLPEHVDHSKVLIECIEHLSLDGAPDLTISSPNPAPVGGFEEVGSTADPRSNARDKPTIHNKSTINPVPGKSAPGLGGTSLAQTGLPRNVRSPKMSEKNDVSANHPAVPESARDPWWATPTGQYMLRIDPISGGFVPRPEGYTGFTLPYIPRQLRYPNESEEKKERVVAAIELPTIFDRSKICERCQGLMVCPIGSYTTMGNAGTLHATAYDKSGKGIQLPPGVDSICQCTQKSDTAPNLNEVEERKLTREEEDEYLFVASKILGIIPPFNSLDGSGKGEGKDGHGHI